MKHIVYIVIVAAVTFFMVKRYAGERVWTSSGGKQIRAQLVFSRGEHEPGVLNRVRLKTDGGRVVNVQRHELSEADQKFLGQWDKGFLATAIGTVVIAIIAWIWLLVAAFGTSIVWGLLVLFVPLCPLIYAILHWDRGGAPFMLSLYPAVIWITISIGLSTLGG